MNGAAAAVPSAAGEGGGGEGGGRTAGDGKGRRREEEARRGEGAEEGEAARRSGSGSGRPRGSSPERGRDGSCWGTIWASGEMIDRGEKSSSRASARRLRGAPAPEGTLGRGGCGKSLFIPASGGDEGGIRANASPAGEFRFLEAR